tara:strand:+ start:1135 stop:1248 length:114 start_codon:yes stop_codon:yes gene_type:complete
MNEPKGKKDRKVICYYSDEDLYNLENYEKHRGKVEEK